MILPRLLQKFATVCDFLYKLSVLQRKIATDILLLKKTLKFDIIYNTVQTGDTRKALALFGWSSCKFAIQICTA